MLKRVGILAFFCVLANVGRLTAEDVYFHASLSDLELTEGSLPVTNEANWSRWWRNRNKPAYAVLDGEGEVYVKYFFNTRQVEGAPGPDMQREIGIRVPQVRDVTGRLFLPSWDNEGMQVARFRLPASQARAESRGEFYELKLAHYEDLLSSGVPGAAWFRHEVRMAQEALGREVKDARPGRTPPGRRPAHRRIGGHLCHVQRWSSDERESAVGPSAAGRQGGRGNDQPRFHRRDHGAGDRLEAVPHGIARGFGSTRRENPVGSTCHFLPVVQCRGGDGRRDGRGRGTDSAVGRAAFDQRSHVRAVPAPDVPDPYRHRSAAGPRRGAKRRGDRIRSLFPHRHRRGRPVRGGRTDRAARTC